jgi:hypothetical protein
MKIHALLGAVALATTTVYAHDFDFKGIDIGHPWAAPTMPGAKTGAAYIGLHNTTQRVDQLVSARTPRAKRVEIHATSRSGDVVRMREAETIELKPGAKIDMRPGCSSARQAPPMSKSWSKRRRPTGPASRRPGARPRNRRRRRKTTTATITERRTGRRAPPGRHCRRK